jgi:hypothetical protein
MIESMKPTRRRCRSLRPLDNNMKQAASSAPTMENGAPFEEFNSAHPAPFWLVQVHR